MKQILAKPLLVAVLVAGVLLLQHLSFQDVNPPQPTRQRSEESAPHRDSNSGPFAAPDWQEMLRSDTPLLEIFVRGSITYLGLFFLLRLFLKRESGSLGVTDLLVVVLLADAVQNAMAGSYLSITDGVLLATVIILWAYVLDVLGYFYPKIERVVHPPPLLLIKSGKIIQENLQQELITEQELLGQLRENGIASIEDVKEAYMESDGRISVLFGAKSGGKINRRKDV